VITKLKLQKHFVT